jgi:hypothetical protein
MLENYFSVSNSKNTSCVSNSNELNILRLLFGYIFPIMFFGRSQWPHGQDMNCLRSLGRWDRGLESYAKHYVWCVYAFVGCLCYPVFR